MTKDSQVIKVMNWLKLFTYISATVLLIANNVFDHLPYLILLVILVSFVNYSRHYYLIDRKVPIQYLWISVILEMLLIIGMGFFDKNNINILFFFVLLSSMIIVHPFVYSIPPAVVYIASGLFIHTGRYGFDKLMQSIVPQLFNYGSSTAFVMIMSYLVKRQMREKEKLARINAELEQAYKKLIENSTAAQQLTIEQERTRMAREIHDTLAHTLTTLIVQLEACKKLASMDPSRLPPELEKAQELSRSGFNDVKRSIKALRPQAMEGKSFFASVFSLINDTMANTNVHISFNNSFPSDIKLASQVEVVIFRVLQESITNSIRHGQAGEIEIAMSQEGDMLQLYISDNGTGCTGIKKGYGIQGIKERIEHLRGIVEFSSSYGKGFKTRVSIPYEVV